VTDYAEVKAELIRDGRVTVESAFVVKPNTVDLVRDIRLWCDGTATVLVKSVSVEQDMAAASSTSP